MLSPSPTKILLLIPGLRNRGADRQLLGLVERLPPRFSSPRGEFEDSTYFEDYLDRAQPTLRAVLGAMRARIPALLSTCRDVWLTPLRVGGRYLARIPDQLLAREVPRDFVDLTRWRPASDEQRRRARARFGLADGDIALVLPGASVWHKHQLPLALALRHLRRQGLLDAHVRVLLAGRAQEPPVGRIFPRWFGILGVARWVTVLGPVRDQVALYHAADAIVSPTRHEGLANVVLEAYACGVPAVITSGANRDGLLKDGETGIEIQGAGAARLAEALARMITRTPAERRKLGARGRAHVERTFHPERVLDETMRKADAFMARKRSP